MAKKKIRVAMIGIDTSHVIEFVRRMQAPDCPRDQKVAGMKAVSCCAFGTPFISKQELEKRTARLEQWKVNVTDSFEQATADCDAVMIEINDPSLHLEYVEKCIGLGKPVFLDKPIADTLDSAKQIVQLVKKSGCRLFSASSLRFAPVLPAARKVIKFPIACTVYGALGSAPAGSSIIWYGVHTFEILQRLMGTGATRVRVIQDRMGAVALVEYPDIRRGIIEMTRGVWNYGGYLRDREQALPFVIDGGRLYRDLLREVKNFFEGTPANLSLQYDTLEIMALLEAAEKSYRCGEAVDVEKY